MGKTKLRLSTIEQRVGGVSLMLLLLLLFVLFCPVSYQDTQAEEVEPLASTSSATIALAISEAPALNITPTASGRFDQTTAQVKVTTSSNNGYKLYLGTADATNAMYSTDNSKAAKINALAEPVATTDFLANTWGYALVSSSNNTNTLQYQAVPESATVVADSPQAAGEYELNFGVKLDTALPAGQYVNNVMVSAIANPTTVTGLMSLTYMQDMTSNICQDTKAANGANIVTPGNEVEKRLIDVRDGKEYWVAKLADGNCWMTQNLALDLTAGQKLTNTDTDLNSKEEWIISTSTEHRIPTAIPTETLQANNYAGYQTTKSWDIGKYIPINPTSGEICSRQPGGADLWDSVLSNSTLDRCENFRNVTDSTNYDTHYLIGNYYQFNTATAGSGGNDLADEVNAPDSICPKSWRLPTSGYSNNAKTSFYNLLYQYGLETQANQNNGSNPSPIDGKYYDIAATPLYFVYSGFINLPNGSLRTPGFNGVYWSSTTASSNPYDDTPRTSAYSLRFMSSSTWPAYAHSKYEGFSVRCLTR